MTIGVAAGELVRLRYALALCNGELQRVASQISKSGFSSKKVRTLSKKHRMKKSLKENDFFSTLYSVLKVFMKECGNTYVYIFLAVSDMIMDI